MFDEQTLEELKQPLLKENVSSRKNYGGSGNLSYVSQDHCIYEANRIFGFDGWDRETIKLTNLGERTYNKGDGANATKMFEVGYMAHVRVTVRADDVLIVREGTGFGNGSGSNPVTIHELATKEAESDAMKRALMTFGNQFGLALYDKAQPNVVANRAGAAEARKEGLYEDMIEELRKKTTVDALDSWWKSSETQANGAKLPKGWVDKLKKDFKSHKLILQQLDQSHELGD